MTNSLLSSNERRGLAQLIRQTHDAHVVLRASALLWLDDDVSVAEVAAWSFVSRQTVYNWCQTFTQRAGWSLEARLTDAARCGRPATLKGVIEPWLAVVVAQDPRDFEYHSTTWTAPLLTRYLHDYHQVDASPQSVRLALERLRLRWKRPRHQLALRPANWRQSKGG